MHSRLFLLLACAIALPACAQGSVDQTQPDPPAAVDMRRDDPVVEPDMRPDMMNEEPDMKPPEPETVRGSQVTSAGGGRAVTRDHKVRVILGAPIPAGEARTPGHKIGLVAGAAQHGQQR